MKDYLPEMKKIIANRLDLENYRLFLFGSRSEGTNRRFSDYDLGILGPKKVSATDLALMSADLDDSEIPYRVEIVDFQNVSESLRRVAMKKVRYL